MRQVCRSTFSATAVHRDRYLDGPALIYAMTYHLSMVLYTNSSYPMGLIYGLEVPALIGAELTTVTGRSTRTLAIKPQDISASCGLQNVSVNSSIPLL